MFYGRFFSNKYQQYKKRNWSAPMLMSVFIIISLLVVFSFEEIGLFRKENNLSSEVMHIGKSNLIKIS